jgi:hypothetical protein
MEHNLEHTVALLARTPAVLNALLRDLPEMWASGDEGENTWNARDVVAHLIHAEHTDWIPRARMILEFGEAQTFKPFQRGGHVQESQSKMLPQLLDEFAKARAASLGQLRTLNLRKEDLERHGKHPAFGTVTLSALLATWAVHDLTHLHQISRTLAHQYRETVGPWSVYLGVLQCTGHSAAG